ncbi:MAG: hypothetical protein GF307_04295 [candidate division Zixibacteria bacterium]|nr:hypothetical protein [candidate division Zixibacteria bacterium]
MDNTLLIIILAGLAALLIIVMMFFRRAKRREPGSARDEYILGLKAQFDKRIDEAYEHFKKTVSLDTENVDAYLRLGNILRLKNSLDRAFQIHRELSMRGNLTEIERQEINEAMVEDLFAAEKYDEAGKTLRGLLSGDSRNEVFLEKLLEVYTLTGDWVNAIPTVERLARINPDKYDRRFQAMYKILEGIKHANSGDGHKARLIYKEALNLYNKCALAYLYIGDAYVQDNRLNDAIDWWKKLCHDIPGKSHICFEKLESALFETGKFSDIAEIYLRILEKDEKNIRAIRALARIQTKMGKKPEAIRNLKRTLEIKPNDYESLTELMEIYREEENLQELASIAEEYCILRKKEIEPAELYICSECGHAVPEPEPLCAKCHRVGTYGL